MHRLPVTETTGGQQQNHQRAGEQNRRATVRRHAGILRLLRPSLADRAPGRLDANQMKSKPNPIGRVKEDDRAVLLYLA
jgi:hypothetical protein